MSQHVSKFLRPTILGAAIAATLASPVVSAQGRAMIEEVIVTATKRAATLQEIPIAVSVVTAESMEQAQVLDIKDLQTLVPSLRVTQLQSSANTNFVIRGFGNGANNAGIEPSVGVFIDGVYRSRVGSALSDLPKLERVEVLRGPQSTLFGKNASAGVISIVTAKPDMDAYSGSAAVTFGEYNQTLIRGDITGPITDNLAFSLFASKNERDGYYDNLFDGSEQNEIDRWNLRGQALWTPTDRLEMRFIVDADKLDEVCCGVANLVDGPTGGAVRFLGGNLVPNDGFAYEGFFDFNPVNTIETQGASLEINYDFEEFTLTSITAYRELEQTSDGDVDFTSAKLVSINANETNIDTFTQELRLTSAGGEALNWMVGLFYFTEDVSIVNDFRYGDDFRGYGDLISGGAISFVEGAFGIPPGTFFASGSGFPDERGGQDDKTYSVFGQADYSITDDLVLTVGANYTEVEKEAEFSIVSTDVFSSLPLPDFLAGLRPFQFLPPFLNYPNSVETGETTDDEVTWTVRLAYDVNDNINVYAGASTGFKATSWNLSRDSRPFDADVPALAAAGLVPPNLSRGTRFAGPEEALVYEIGLKGEFDTFGFNIAIFDQEIKGFQSNIFSGTGFSLSNAGKQSVEGVEFDINWFPVEGLRLAFAATYLDPLYDDFQGALGLGQLPTDLSGQTPAGIHEWSITTSATYNFEVGASANGYARIEYIYEDDIQVVDNIPTSIASREVSMFNASVGINWNNGFDINIWGRNLNDDEFLLSAFPSVAQGGSVSGYPSQPRTFGITLRKNFE